MTEEQVELNEEPVELTDSLDIEIAVDKYLTEIGVEFSYMQIPSGLNADDMQRVVLPNLKEPYSTEEKGMPIKFKLQFLRKGKVLFETDYGQGIAYAPKKYYSWGMYNSKTIHTLLVGKKFTDLCKWVDRAKQGGRDLQKLDGFRFTHDFLYVNDFEQCATRSSNHVSVRTFIADMARIEGVKEARKRLSLEGYGEGVSAAGALSCLVGDAQAAEQTFEDWCGEFGYDSDSRKAEATYRACDDIGKKLKQVFSPDRLDHIRTLTQNY